MTLNSNSLLLLWLTRGGQVSGESAPAFSVRTGLFRSIRAESSTRRMVTLDLSLQSDLLSPSAVQTIAEVLKTLLDNMDMWAQDWKFAKNKGLLHVQRLVEDSGLDSAEASETTAPQALMEKLFQENRLLKMIVGQSGSFDPFQFVDNDKYMQNEIPPEYVEIKVMYTDTARSRPPSVSLLPLTTRRAHICRCLVVLGEVPPRALDGEVGGVVTAVGSEVKGLNGGNLGK